MKTKAQEWIEKLEAAIEARERLPQMSGQDRHHVIMLMHKAGRRDLASMASRVIPIDRSGARRMSIREFAAREVARRKLH